MRARRLEETSSGADTPSHLSSSYGLAYSSQSSDWGCPRVTLWWGRRLHPPVCSQWSREASRGSLSLWFLTGMDEPSEHHLNPQRSGGWGYSTNYCLPTRIHSLLPMLLGVHNLTCLPVKCGHVISWWTMRCKQMWGFLKENEPEGGRLGILSHSPESQKAERASLPPGNTPH